MQASQALHPILIDKFYHIISALNLTSARQRRKMGAW
jgi:hypothetical protein